MGITFILNLVPKKKVCRWGGFIFRLWYFWNVYIHKKRQPSTRKKISIPNKKNDVLFTIISESNQKNINEINSTNSPIPSQNENLIQPTIILDQEAQHFRQLMLEDYKGCLFNHKRLVINAVGLVNSLRNKRDGTTFFGLFLTKKGKIMNDFILNGKIQCMSKSVFNISFDRILQSYCFKSFYDKIFIKVQSNKWNPIRSLLNKKTFIQIGEDVFSIKKAEKEIKINFVSQKLNYSFPETENEITIGRNEKCKVRVNSSILSKIIVY